MNDQALSHLLLWLIQEREKQLVSCIETPPGGPIQRTKRPTGRVIEPVPVHLPALEGLALVPISPTQERG